MRRTRRTRGWVSAKTENWKAVRAWSRAGGRAGVGWNGGLGFTGPLLLCNQFPYRREQLYRDLDDGLSLVLKSGLVLSDRLFFRLLLVMGKYPAYSRFIPAGWKSLHRP